MITVSPNFTAAQAASVAKAEFLVNLILGNYAASAEGATATSSGAAANYPATGANDGDRTEINVGAAADADNGVGQSSWKSDVVPDGTGNVWLEIDFGQERVFNRLKLYNLDGDSLTSYLVQYWDGAIWVDFAGSEDRYLPATTDGYGGGGYGTGPYGDDNPWTPAAGVTGGLDVFEFDDITSEKIKIIVYATESAGAANLVEVEVYRMLDITSRVKTIKLDRRRDFKVINPIATQCDITCRNTDKFFSISYSPTAAEVTSGFVNSELAQLGFGLEVSEGFFTAAGLELIRTFTGSADVCGPSALKAEAEISCRDGMKHVIDQSDSCNLREDIDLADAVKYILNRNNVSDYEMSLDQTGITLGSFFTFQEPILTTIQQIVQAAGDAIFYYDENGIAVFDNFLSTQQWAGVGSFNTGTLTNIDTTLGVLRRNWFIIDNFADGQYSSNPVWTVVATNGGSATPAAGYLDIAAAGVAKWIGVQTPFTLATGTWSMPINITALSASGSSNNGDGFEWLFFNSAALNGSADATGYALRFNLNSGGGAQNQVQLMKYAGANVTLGSVLASLGTFTTGANTWSVSRTAAGVFRIYKNGALVGTATDTTYTASSYHVLAAETVNSSASITARVTDIYWSPTLDNVTAVTNAIGTWVSPTYTYEAGVVTLGKFNANSVLDNGSTVSYATRTSADGSIWDAWAAATPGSDIASTIYPTTYLQVRAIINCTTDDGLNNANTTGYLTFVDYVAIGNGNKFAASPQYTLSWDSEIMDLKQRVADNLGGDTAVINDIAVSSAPLVLSGEDTDTTWQGTAGIPPDKISATNPKVVSVGTYDFKASITGGMDTSRMTGANPAAVAITWGTAVGSVTISYIHPSKPVITLTVTSGGTITDFRLIGKTYQNQITPYLATATSASSIVKHRRRHTDVSNNYIINNGIAQIIANKAITNFASPTVLVDNFPIVPVLYMQPGDRFTLVDVFTGINEDYYVAGYTRVVNVSEDSAEYSQDVTAIKVPAGL